MASHKILLLFAHPLFEKSQAHKELIKHIPVTENITFHDLYELYPEFNVDINREQALLKEHDIIIWQHPLYWYSCPPLLKQWIDLVLEYKWAYGSEGNALEGKYVFQVVTTGGNQENYCKTGRDRFTIYELLEPFNQTAQVCKMKYLPPYVVHGTFDMEIRDYVQAGKAYGSLLNHILTTGFSEADFKNHVYMNDWYTSLNTAHGI
ncbi:NAD(P)H-dependent oxidoreductase [Arenibacter sp. GZD96]|uniref:NAD(P)H-dependent oxidoreductase n=1 Tax=Aurantibrevibacter litoralis TaxID=3106030 RepID=UPI002AFF643A|nr:NAD(P)H-dependent oxidoreductase [Arenibacter sp. GZD-96]MEA1787416.1 NAD(P)H-dependent oxidoreductase [Arenibacter sp. GZD-96]